MDLNLDKDSEHDEMKAGTREDRKVNVKSIILILLFIIAAVIIIVLQTKNASVNPSTASGPGKGAPAPNFTLPGLDGKMVSLTDYRGKVVLLNIWATWCPPCVEEMPSMQKLYQAMRGEAFELLAVSLDESGAGAVVPFMKNHKLSFPALIDSEATLQKLYGTTGVPESFIIDKKGMIIEKIIGPRDWSATAAVRYFQDLSQIE